MNTCSKSVMKKSSKITMVLILKVQILNIKSFYCKVLLNGV